MVQYRGFECGFRVFVYFLVFKLHIEAKAKVGNQDHSHSCLVNKFDLFQLIVYEYNPHIVIVES